MPINARKGEQHTPEFRAINPNAKTPAIVDGETAIFDSNAILLYLAEKTGQFLPANTPEARGPMYSWLMFVASGIGPYCGQCVHELAPGRKFSADVLKRNGVPAPGEEVRCIETLPLHQPVTRMPEKNGHQLFVAASWQIECGREFDAVRHTSANAVVRLVAKPETVEMDFPAQR